MVPPRLVIRYDPEADVLAVRLREGAVADEELLDGDAVVGYDREGRVVYVEVLDASKKGLACALHLRELLEGLERLCGVKLPRSAADVHVDCGQDLLFVRFKEPSGVELGEPAPTRSIIIVFTDEAGELTAVEVVGVKDAVEELCRQQRPR